MRALIIALSILLAVAGYSQSPLSEINLEIDRTNSGDGRLALLEKGRNQISTESNDSIVAEFYLRAGITYGILGNRDSSIIYFDRAIEVATPTQHFLRSRSINGKGNVSRQIGENQRALEYFLLALREVEGKEDLDSRYYEGSLLGNLAGIYFGMGDIEKAEDYTNRGLEIAETYNMSEDIAYSQVRLALIYAVKEEYDKALESHEIASALIEEHDITYLSGYNQINLAKLYSLRGEQEKALNVYSELLKEDTRDVEVMTSSLENSSRIYLDMKDYDNAIASAQRLLENANQNGILPSAVSANEILYTSFQKKGNYREANKYLNQYINLNDSLVNTESLNAISELEAKYENEKKEQEIIALKLENQQAANQRNVYLFITGIVLIALVFLGVLVRSKNRSNKLISKSLSEKETLLKEIHHRVKNNLQVISSLLSLQSRYIDDEKAQAAISEGQNRVKSMALIHQKLYQHENLLGIEAKDYIENLTASLRSAYNYTDDQVSVQYDISDLKIDVDTIIPIGLILNELISNSFKHAFPEGKEGEISIRLGEENEKLKLEVKDNGVGSKEPPSTSGSFGMRMINSLAMKLEASVNFDFSKGTSTVIEMSNYKLI